MGIPTKLAMRLTVWGADAMQAMHNCQLCATAHLDTSSSPCPQNRNLLAWREHHHEQVTGGLGALGAIPPAAKQEHAESSQHTSGGRRQPLLALPASGNARAAVEGHGGAPLSSRGSDGQTSGKRPPTAADLDAKRTALQLQGNKHQAAAGAAVTAAVSAAAKENTGSDADVALGRSAAGRARGASSASVQVSLDRIIDELTLGR